jgi:signal transduction histidine kinase
VILFAVSVTVLAAVVYVISTTALDRQTRLRIYSEAKELAADYHTGGMHKMLADVRARQLGRLVGGLDYTVFDRRGTRIYGTLPHPATHSGWNRMQGPPDGDEAPGRLEQLIVYAIPLGHDGWLMVGDDIGKVQRVGRLIMTTFGWALLVMLTLAVVGGMALSAAFLGRIDSITRTAEAIIGGDIRRRMPLRGIDDDIDRLSTTLNRMLDRISGLMETLHQVSSDIAHDLRTPLSRMRHILDEARHSAQSTDEYAQAVDRALHQNDAILETFAAILRIAQIESGSRRANFQAIDLCQLAQSISQTYGPVAEDAGSHLTVQTVPTVPLQGDRELLMQMLVNLIENAICHAGTGTAIAISITHNAKGPVLRVADDGPGIPEHERQAVLRRFYRLERSRTTPGSGLGLSLVAAIVELHGAELVLEDNHPGLAVFVQFASEGGNSAMSRFRTSEPAEPGILKLAT